MTREISEQAADWALRLVEGGISDEERSAFDAWLNRDPEHGRAYAKANRILGDAKQALTGDPDRTKRLLRRGNKTKRACLTGLVLLVALGTGYLAPDANVMLRADLSTASHETATHILPDGSRIHLNAESAIVENFDGTRRHVDLLRGEAYFEVTRDPSRPFTVSAGGGRIEVLGTAFDVNLVGGDGEVTVIEHQVKVSGAETSETLRPGQRVFYSLAGELGQVRKVPAGFEAPWRSGRLVFDDRPLGKVVSEIFRHLPGKVMILEGDLANRHISGTFDLRDPVAAFRSFRTAFGLKTFNAGGLVTIIY